jgi:hypothetical protein
MERVAVAPGESGDGVGAVARGFFPGQRDDRPAGNRRQQLGLETRIIPVLNGGRGHHRAGKERGGGQSPAHHLADLDARAATKAGAARLLRNQYAGKAELDHPVPGAARRGGQVARVAPAAQQLGRIQPGEEPLGGVAQHPGIVIE